MNYYHCIQSNFSINSNYKSLNLPFSIYRTSFNYLRNSPEKTDRRKNFGISNSTMFIGARQNLKAMNIHLTHNSKYNNIAKREITNLKNGKYKSVDKVNNLLAENDISNYLKILKI